MENKINAFLEKHNITDIDADTVLNTYYDTLYTSRNDYDHDPAELLKIRKRLAHDIMADDNTLVTMLPGFTYENTNPRWEMLEYGYYKNEESKIRIGTPYGYKHGVKGHHSIQAPYGFVRLTEAWWENMKESHRRFDFLANFVKRNSLDVSKIKQNTVEKLRKYDQTLNTNELDWGNFVQAGI